MIITSHHGSYSCDSGLSKRVTQSVEKPCPGAFQARLRPNLNCENPAARRLSEFPGAYFSDDKSLEAIFVFGNQ